MFESNCPTETSLGPSRNRSVAIEAAFILLLVAMAGDAAAATARCNPQPAQHQVSARCRIHQARRTRREPIKPQAPVADPDALTPLTDAKAPRAAGSWPSLPLRALSLPSPRRSGAADDVGSSPPPFDRSPVSVNARGGGRAVMDLIGGATRVRTALSTSTAWSILSLGLAGVFFIVGLPGAAKVRSWAMEVAPRGGRRPENLADAVDRLDGVRYAEDSGRRSHGGRFVRAAATHRFGAHF
jgi:hypothetical protein